MKSKKAELVESWRIVFPNDANPGGSMFGGKLMAIMDEVSAIAASRYTGRLSVTASTEAMDFKCPVKIGDYISVTAKVVWVGNTSLIVKTDVWAETPPHESKRHCTTAHFTFVALDSVGRPEVVAPLEIETEQDKQDYEVAKIIKNNAMERRKKIRATRTET